MGIRDELLAEVGPKTHIADICGRAADELLIKQMKIDQQVREIERLRAALHVTITRQTGVVPDLALEFYDPRHPALGRMAQS